MDIIASIWTFETSAFSFQCSALPCASLCLDFDDSGDVGDQIDDFSLVAFDACVTVTHKDSGAVLGSSVLSDVILSEFNEFCSHPGFRVLVSEAVRNVRMTLNDLAHVQLAA